jgi:hypothetical protein
MRLPAGRLGCAQHPLRWRIRGNECYALCPDDTIGHVNLHIRKSLP